MATVPRAVEAPWPPVADRSTIVTELLLASPRSFCAGVERAIQTVAELLDRHGAPIYVRREIVHNAHVVADLRNRGAIFVQELDEVPDGAIVVFSAHGVAPVVHEQAAARGQRVVDATCPLVSKVHAEARRFARRGDTILLIGHADHEEVEGTRGEAPDAIRVIETEYDAATVEVPDPDRVTYLTQTTLSVTETAGIIDVLRRRFPALQAPPDDDICYATTNRQHATRAVARRAELVLVVGSANSSNAARMVEVARREGATSYLIEDATALDPTWLDGVTTVGLTAGASTPPELVDGVIAVLHAKGAVTVDEISAGDESGMHFALPRLVRSRDEGSNP
jgi:4-hydroxy-3-methylbut-2-enyl diphosphate reductase